MTWHEARQHFPDQWLLVEATRAHSEPGRRIVEQLAVVDTFSDSPAALDRYRQLHREAPAREFYVLHTSRETLDISESHRFFVRATRPESIA